MSASSRALAALTLAAALLVPAPSAWGLTSSGPTHVRNQPAVAAPRTDTTVDADAEATPLPRMATKGWVLADMDTGEILAMHDAERPLRPASTLKLLTALTVVPRLSPGQPYRAVAEDENAEGNRVVLYEGLDYTVQNLLHAMLLPSANDAAEALARANGGLETTVAQMNAEADRLGAVDTTAVNPSGLDDDGQTTTALDLAVIGRAALTDPEISSYLKLRTADFPGKQTSRGRVIYPIYNQNRLVIDDFEGALGGKSGYTTLARRTYVGAAERDGRRFLVSLLDIGGNTYSTAEVLLDWAFANAEALNPVGQLPEPTAAAPTFDRTITALPAIGAEPASRIPVDGSGAAQSPDTAAPLAAAPGDRLPSSPLTVMTLLAGALVVLRARVYWRGYRRPTRPDEAASPTRPGRGPGGSTGPSTTHAITLHPREPIDLRKGTPRRADATGNEALIGVGP